MVNRKYTKEQEEFVREIAPGRYNDEIAELFNKKFNMNISTGQMRAFKANRKIKSGVPKRRVTEDDGLFTKEQKLFIKDNVKGLLNRELAELVNKKYNLAITELQISTYKKNHGLKSGIDAKFKKGNKAWNKGMKGLDLAGENGRKTQFKKGVIPPNYRPVGSTRLSRDGYLEIKVADPNKWKLKHRVVWEEKNGPVPEGHAVIFADRDRFNFNLDNLILVSRAQLAVLNKNNLIQYDADLTRTGIIVADIYSKISERKKQSNA